MKRAIWLAFLLLTNCGDWLRTPCGCPIGTICQPDPLTPGAMAYMVEKVASAVGWHVALTGSVLLVGQSLKDLDLVLYPHKKTKEQPDLTELNSALKTIPDFSQYRSVSQVKEYWRQIGSSDEKHVEIWLYGCKRVDLFILR